MEIKGQNFLVDQISESFSQSIKVKEILYHAVSDYQEITVIETLDIGRVLLLDNVFNVSPMMEFYYHEPMAHVPLGLKREHERVLIIGGGDFGVARQVLKHEGVKEAVLCELDAKVLEACRRFFPEWAACEDDPRLQVVEGDGFRYVEQSAENSFDVIIVDSTDPFHFADVLISREFYQACHQALRPGGVMMQIAADLIFYTWAWETIINNARSSFELIRPLFLPVPFYTTGNWGFLVLGKEREDLDPAAIDAEFLNAIPGLQTMTPELVRGWFSVPPVVKKLFKGLLPAL
ncbi:MAG: fused MFS/spermidine synthase [bacterium]